MTKSNKFKCWLYDIDSEDCCTLGKDSNIDDWGNPVCQVNCVNYSRIYAMLRSAGIPEIFWNTLDTKLKTNSQDLNSFHVLKSIEDQIVDFVNNGENLFVFSPNFGNGKTSWAVRLGKQLIKEISFECCDENLLRYVYFPDYVFNYNLNLSYSFDNQNRINFLDYTKQLSKVALVIWDGYNYNSGTSAENVVLNSIIQSRLNSGLSNVFVSYKDPEDIKNAIYDKEDSRTVGLKRSDVRIVDSSICVKIFGKNRRRDTSIISDS